IAVLWFVICLQPVISTTQTREDPTTRVIVALDTSGSMFVTDPLRPTVDKLRLAHALRLKVLGAQPPTQLVNDWIRQYEEAGARGKDAFIRWVPESEGPTNPEERRQLEAKRREMHDKLCNEVDKLTRTEIVLRLLAADGGRLLNKLSEDHQ